MSLHKSFYMPWYDYFKEAKNFDTLKFVKFHQYKHRQFDLLKGENIIWWNKPYFAIANEAGMLDFFLKALFLERKEEAKVYLSKDFHRKMNLDEVEEIFKDCCEYKYLIYWYFDKQMKYEMNLIPIEVSTKDVDGTKQIDIVHVQMVSEPNRYGKWKIHRIVKE